MSDLVGAPKRLDVADVLRGKRLLFVGATGFVGKVALSLFLRRYPEMEKMFVLVRPGAGSSSEERFFEKIVSSPTFDPIREVWGDGTEAYLREKCAPLAGDVSRPMLNFTPEDLARIGHLDVIINCAGLVSFNPTLETALRINVLGPRYVLDVARATGARVVHISTCFVAGNRDGDVWEDEPVAGYFPRKDELRDDDFSVDAEITDCQRIIEQVKARSDDRAHVSEFRARGAARLKAEGRDADDERTLKIAVQRERKVFIAEKLTELGMERALHWGWTNTYTYTKSLGEQVCATSDIPCTIVRPAIVESATQYPFAGWNEGFTTTAPLAYLTIKGHRNYPHGENIALDLIPVDMVAAGIVMATAALIDGTQELVYQLGSSDLNPLWVKRSIEMLGLYKHTHFRKRREEGEGSALINRILSRLEPVAVTRERYNRTSDPLWKSIADGVIGLIDQHTPRWGAPRLQGMAEHAKHRLGQISRLSQQTDSLFQLFMPFICEKAYIFHCDNTRALHARLSPQDQLGLNWAPDQINWRDYWLKVHLPGLEKWVYPSLEEEFKARAKSVYTYRDLLEMFDAATKHHRSRTAMRRLPRLNSKKHGERYSYADLQNLAERVGANLRERGVLPGDKVMLLSENRPEWGICYFGILKAGAVVVPVDFQSTPEEVKNLLGYSGAKMVIVSTITARRMLEAGIETTAQGVHLRELITTEPSVTPESLAPIESTAKASDMASLIFTSGTTGRPKGVMLSHHNFTSQLSKLSSVFDIDKHDGLLSVLPLHHTFEFTAGLLMPLMRGAQITYMGELSPEALEDAFKKGHVTGMVGVPALWQALERKIMKQVDERGPLISRAFKFVVEVCRKLRDEMPLSLESTLLNFPRFLFFPVHQAFGGRLRLQISGGSALSPDTLKLFRGLGFNLFEGYGMTESSPVLTVNRPGKRLLPGSVGEPLPGVDVVIDKPDEHGVGEVIASGPNVMMGYYENPEATAETVQDGWLHTGDLGRIDDRGRLFIVGRKKEMILSANGENVYPDELEELYRDSPYVKELSIVGLPDENGGETVACLLVPNYDPKHDRDASREQVKARVHEHMRSVSVKLPLHKRVKVLHLVDFELPKTATRKVKRKLVVEELAKFERLRKSAEAAVKAPAKEGAQANDWLFDLIATVANKSRDKVHAQARMEEIGFDSLMYAELGVALEAAGIVLPETLDLTGVATAGDLAQLARKHQTGGAGKKGKSALVASNGVKKSATKKSDAEADEIHIPAPVAHFGRQALTWAQGALYQQLLHTRVTGKTFLPQTGSFLVAANHASHLDMGLVKHALGEWGPHLVALAAKDYFFEDPIKRAYFENFTNLVPMDRHGSLRESLRLASEVIRQGHILLIFPEGTRSESGVMVDFKPSLGYLALANNIDVLPMYLEGTHGALPKGSVLPKNRDIAAHLGPVIRASALKEATKGMSKSDAYREASRIVERAVRNLAPAGSVNRGPAMTPSGKVTAQSVMAVMTVDDPETP